MEGQVLHWMLTSKFYLDNKGKIEIIPQFDVGAYLKQLDPTYNHPKYKADFLFSYKEWDSLINIIVEYDGFKEHFSDLRNVNSWNFDLHYKEGDIYRQKVLESYGYAFLRFNRFNLDPKESPEDTVSEKLKEVIEAVLKSRISRVSLMQDIINDVESYKNGKKKLCPKCGDLKDLSSFIDNSLSSGEWRYCMECKQISSSSTNQRVVHHQINSAMPQKDIEILISKAISEKETILIFYKGSWRRVRPMELCNDNYMGHFYRCMKGRLPDGEDRKFNVAKIYQINNVG